MPPLAVGTIAGTKGKPATGGQPDTREPIKLTSDWTKPWGQVIPVTARNNDNNEILTLREELHGFYAYKISCECPEVQRSGLPSVIKIGRSAGDSGGLKSRLQSYPVTHSMNDVTLLKVIVFKTAKHAAEFEKHVKQALLSRGILHVAGYEWFAASQQSEIIGAVNDVRDELKSVTPRSRSATPTAAPAPAPAATPALVFTARPRTGPKPKPAPPRSAPVAVKKAYVKNAAMKVRNQAIRDGKSAAYAAEAFKKEKEKWEAYYGI